MSISNKIELTPEQAEPTKTVCKIKDFPNGDKYYGELNTQGLRHGFGSCFYANGDYYEGEWENDEWNGSGGSIDHK